MDHPGEIQEGGNLTSNTSSPSNVYFLGRAGVIDFEGIRIWGLSGIYSNPKEYEKPLPNKPNLWW